MLDVESSKPLYVQVIEDIEKKLMTGVYVPGEKLLPEGKLAKFYGVSSITIKKAVSILAERGILEKKQGKGTFVSRERIHCDFRKRMSFTETCAYLGVQADGKMLENKLVLAEDKIADQLKLSHGGSVVYLARLRYADGEPVVIEKNWFPLKYESILDYEFDDKSLFEYLKQYENTVIASSEKKIKMCRATSEEAKLLGLKKDEPLLYIRSIAYSELNAPIYVGEQIANGYCFAFYMYESQMSW